MTQDLHETSIGEVLLPNSNIRTDDSITFDDKIPLNESRLIQQVVPGRDGSI